MTKANRGVVGAHLSGFDIEAAVSSQRKNIEALTQANQLAVEGAQALMRRQVEITRQAVEDFSAMFRDFVQPNGLAFSPDGSRVFVVTGDLAHPNTFHVLAISGPPPPITSVSISTSAISSSRDCCA